MPTQTPPAIPTVSEAERRQTIVGALLDRVVDVLDQSDPDVDLALALVAIAHEELDKIDP